MICSNRKGLAMKIDYIQAHGGTPGAQLPGPPSAPTPEVWFYDTDAIGLVALVIAALIVFIAAKLQKRKGPPA